MDSPKHTPLNEAILPQKSQGLLDYEACISSVRQSHISCIANTGRDNHCLDIARKEYNDCYRLVIERELVRQYTKDKKHMNISDAKLPNDGKLPKETLGRPTCERNLINCNMAIRYGINDCAKRTRGHEWGQQVCLVSHEAGRQECLRLAREDGC